MDRNLWEYNHLLHQIGRMHHTLCENTVAGLGIHRSQHRLLMHLHRRDGATQKELAEELEVSPAAVAVSLKKLEGEGFVRKASSQDGRVNQVYITEKGKQIAESSRSFFEAIDAEMFSSLSEEEFDALYSILEKIEANLKNAIEKEKSTI
ncbi:MAG: MarR family transcriptional regulator [Clostridia bacterium]|nr:MarR family transcriptional regulator [Clostridia bacterium]